MTNYLTAQQALELSERGKELFSKSKIQKVLGKIEEVSKNFGHEYTQVSAWDIDVENLIFFRNLGYQFFGTFKDSFCHLKEEELESEFVKLQKAGFSGKDLNDEKDKIIFREQLKGVDQLCIYWGSSENLPKMAQSIFRGKIVFYIQSSISK